MRESLIPLLGQRLTVQAPVLRFSKTVGWAGVWQSTVMLGPVTTQGGAVLTDHLWFTMGQRLAALDLHLGDVVQFSGRVTTYRRNYRREPGQPATWTEDYGLRYPTRCLVLARAERTRAIQGPERPRTNRLRVLGAIRSLWQEAGQPPTLGAVLTSAGMNPLTALNQLHRMAKAGMVAFQPNGTIFTTPAAPTTERTQL
jgi:hypothetical protein